MIEYVAGFLFSGAMGRVALVKKLKGPVCNIGKWNAIGGKVEQYESPYRAMIREFTEETGVFVVGWHNFLILEGLGWRVFFYVASNSELLSSVRTMEAEPIFVFDTNDLGHNLASNLSWIIPMALTYQDQHVQKYIVTEQHR